MIPSSAPGQLLRWNIALLLRFRNILLFPWRHFLCGFSIQQKKVSLTGDWYIGASHIHFHMPDLITCDNYQNSVLRKPWRKSEHHLTQAYWVSCSSWLSLFLGQLIGLKPWNVQVRKLSICPGLLAGSFQIGFGVIGSPRTGDLKGQSCPYCSCQRQWMFLPMHRMKYICTHDPSVSRDHLMPLQLYYKFTNDQSLGQPLHQICLLPRDFGK